MFMSMLDKKQSNVNFFSKAMLDGTLCGTMIMLKKNWSHQPFDVHFFFPDDLLTS
jgi:type VI protein secretion system component VasF